MLKRILSAVVAALVVAGAAYGASINITGTNSEFRNSIFQMGIPRITRDESITATPSGTISTSYQLTAGISYVTTVASSGDAVKLPNTVVGSGAPSGGGMQLVIINATSNPMNVFPFQAADTINALSPGAAFSLAAGKTATFIVGIDGKWYVNLSA